MWGFSSCKRPICGACVASLELNQLTLVIVFIFLFFGSQQLQSCLRIYVMKYHEGLEQLCCLWLEGVFYKCFMHPTWWSMDLLLMFVELMVEWPKSWDDIHGKEETERQRDVLSDHLYTVSRNQSYFAEVSKTKKQNIGEQCPSSVSIQT